MGSFLSKCRPLPYTCHEVAHTWTPHCTVGALDVGGACAKESLKIYSTLYFVGLLLRRKVPSKEDFFKMLISIAQSTAFLSYNAFGFVWAHCFIRQLLGFSNFWTLSFLPGWVCSFLSIFLERQSRRSMLATYVTNVAAESSYKSLLNHKIIPKLHNVDVVLFGLTMSGLLYLQLVKKEQSKDPIMGLVRKLTGEEENVDQPLKPRENDFDFVVQDSLKHFLFGAAGQQLFTIFKTYRSGNPVTSNLFDQHRIGLFLGTLTFFTRIYVMMFKRISGSLNGWHSVLIGLLTSPVYLLYRNSTLVQYAFWKFTEVGVKSMNASGHLPTIPFFTELLYATSTALLFHYGFLEPHSLRGSYFVFINRITGHKMSEVNRSLVDLEYPGSQASKRIQFLPLYEAEFISERLRRHFPEAGDLK